MSPDGVRGRIKRCHVRIRFTSAMLSVTKKHGDLNVRHMSDCRLPTIVYERVDAAELSRRRSLCQYKLRQSSTRAAMIRVQICLA